MFNHACNLPRLKFFLFKAKRYLLRILIERVYGKHSLPIGPDYDEAKAGTYEQTRAVEGFWKEEQKSIHIALEKLPGLSSVLDAPFGTGRFLDIFAAHDYKVIGLDISADMFDVAKSNHPDAFKNVDIHICNLKSIPIKSSSVDLICCYRFLSWIVSFKEADIIVKELQRVCKKFALLELCVGYHKTGEHQIKNGLTMWNRMNFHEINLWLNSCGFEVIDTIPIWDDKEHPGLTTFVCKKINIEDINQGFN